MKNYSILFAAALAFLAAACTSNEIEENKTEGEYRIHAIVSEDATKGSVDNDDASKFTWNTGDKIAFMTNDWVETSPLSSDYEGKAQAVFSITNEQNNARGGYALYPSNIHSLASSSTDYSYLVNLPGSYTIDQVKGDKAPTPMIASNTKDGDWKLYVLCPLLRVRVYNIPKQTKKLVFDFNDKTVCGSFEIANSSKSKTIILGTTAINATDIYSSPLDSITVTMADNTTWHDYLDINLPVPVGTYGDITITAYEDGEKTLLSVTQPIKDGGWTPARKSSRKMTAYLPVFTTREGKKILFAPGNLQYNPTGYSGGPVFKFAENQFTVIGNAAGNNTAVADRATMNAWIDLFGWGTSGYNSKNPWAASDNRADYVNDGSNIAGTGYDWGVNNRIYLSSTSSPFSVSYEPGTWRTPTQNEWLDLYQAGTFIRCTNRYVQAKVESQRGFIFFPDNFVAPSGITLNLDRVNQSYGSGYYDKNVFDSTQWAKLEANGAVFLSREGGARVGTTVNLGSGSYWSATAQEPSYSFYLGISDSNINATSTANMEVIQGLSVRLIRDLN